MPDTAAQNLEHSSRISTELLVCECVEATLQGFSACANIEMYNLVREKRREAYNEEKTRENSKLREREKNNDLLNTGLDSFLFF